MLLPGDLEGDLNLVFVAFQRRHQNDIDHWLRELNEIEADYEGLAVYEIPLLMRFPAFYRRWIDDGMRSGIPDPKTRSRTITVYTNRREFLDEVALPDESEILVALLDREGGMVWRHLGAATQEALRDLTAVLCEITTHRSDVDDALDHRDSATSNPEGTGLSLGDVDPS